MGVTEADDWPWPALKGTTPQGQEERVKKGCSSEQRPLSPPWNKTTRRIFNIPQWRQRFLPTLLPELRVCVCLYVWTHGVTDSYRVGVVFFLPAAYQVSPGFSVVAAAIHRGWITLMKTGSSFLKQAARTQVEVACKHGELQRKWLAKKKSFFFFIFSSAGTFGLVLNEK